MSGGGGARRPINGGGFITIPRPFPFGIPDLPLPRPRARPIRRQTTTSPTALLPQNGRPSLPLASLSDKYDRKHNVAAPLNSDLLVYGNQLSAITSTKFLYIPQIYKYI